MMRMSRICQNVVDLARAAMVIFLLVWMGEGAVRSLEACESGRQVSDLPMPRRVLLVPLLRAEPGTEESEYWPERPARIIERFYRRRFGADVTWLPEVRIWADYYRQVDRLRQQSAPFDRVIFIGHGGFDGPILNQETLREKRNMTGSHRSVTRIRESQPGIEKVLTIRYDAGENAAFSEFMASHWDRLRDKSEVELRELLTRVEREVQPVDAACFEFHCSYARLYEIEDPVARANRRELCRAVCRKPLFVVESEERVAADRFYRFTEGLKSLVDPAGLIFFGACNPGTEVPEIEPDFKTHGTMAYSSLAGGPHDSYVRLLAAATDRIVAGPIGKSSAADIVNRIRLLEQGRSQHYLRISDPGPACGGD